MNPNQNVEKLERSNYNGAGAKKSGIEKKIFITDYEIDLISKFIEKADPNKDGSMYFIHIMMSGESMSDLVSIQKRWNAAKEKIIKPAPEKKSRGIFNRMQTNIREFFEELKKVYGDSVINVNDSVLWNMVAKYKISSVQYSIRQIEKRGGAIVEYGTEHRGGNRRAKSFILKF